jgi:hypothetical protein
MPVECLVADEKVDILCGSWKSIRAHGEGPHDNVTDSGTAERFRRNPHRVENFQRDDAVEQRRVRFGQTPPQGASD